MAMLPNRKIWTWFEGDWQEGNVPILGSADHGTWLGTILHDFDDCSSNFWRLGFIQQTLIGIDDRCGFIHLA